MESRYEYLCCDFEGAALNTKNSFSLNHENQRLENMTNSYEHGRSISKKKQTEPNDAALNEETYEGSKA